LALKFLIRGFGVYNRFSPTRDIRLWTMGQKRRLLVSVEKVLDWPVTRIIPAHGDIVRENGRTAFRDAFLWALGEIDDRTDPPDL
jgi:hypothetical protein